MSFGVLAEGGLVWREGGDAVELAGLGDVFAAPSLNVLLAEGPAAWRDAAAAAASHDGHRTPIADLRLRLPFDVADYVDFFSSREHVENMARMFRPGADPLPPSWLSLPIGYHGRAGTVAVSGTDVKRPRGILGAGEFGLTQRLDIELELGFVVGVPSGGEPIPTSAFEDHVFGVVLVNDWSARDIQVFEYVPLGPFLGKSFLTSISAWVTPLAQLESRRVEAPTQDPPALPHLAGGRDWALDLELEIELNGETISRGNARTLYWTMPQQLAHATSNGATVRTGDLMASGTISGSDAGSQGSLIELTNNERFLADGDEVVLRASGGGVELGEVRGRVISAD